MRIGPRALALIKHFESCRLTAYLCSAGVWTIGWGATGAGIKAGVVWTLQQADQRFADDLAAFEGGVAKLVPNATPAQFGAMVALAYNIGVSAFGRSSVCRLHNAGDHRGAADAFLAWNKSKGKVVPGLTRRRNAERLLYLNDLAAFDKAIGF